MVETPVKVQYQPPNVRSGSPNTSSLDRNLACFNPIMTDATKVMIKITITREAIKARSSENQSSTAHYLLFHIPNHR